MGKINDKNGQKRVKIGDKNGNKRVKIGDKKGNKRVKISDENVNKRVQVSDKSKKTVRTTNRQIYTNKQLTKGVTNTKHSTKQRKKSA